jgi:hypothetical protein
MSARIRYTDELLGKVRVIQDFLPSPAEMAFQHQPSAKFLPVKRPRRVGRKQRPPREE